MADTLVKKVMLQISAEDGDAEAKLDKISAKADELKNKHPDLAVRIDTAAASAKIGVLREELKGVSKPIDVKIDPKVDKTKLAADGAQSGGAFSDGFSGVFSNPYVIGGAIASALALLPALAASGGAAAGIALGAALLIGTQQVKGPLYDSFHDLTSGLMQVLRMAALPLVKPLGDAFAQIGQWAKNLYPILHQVFASLGPLVSPFAKGLEGLVSGLLPGFLHLMQAAKPAVEALGGVLSQLGQSLGGTLGDLAAGVKGSSQFLSGLSGIIANLLPVVASLADVLATALGPILQAVGQKLMPVLAGAVDQVLNALVPLLPSLANTIGELITLGANILSLVGGPLTGLISNLLGLASKVLPSLIGPLDTVIGWLNNMASAAENVLSVLSKIPGLGWLAPAGDAGYGSVSWANTAVGAVGGSLSGAIAASTAAGFGSWAAGNYGTTMYGSGGPSNAQTTAANKLGQQIPLALGSGVLETIPVAKAKAAQLMAEIKKELASGAITQAQATTLVNQVATALASREAAVKAAARKLGESLTITLADQIASSNSASTMATAVGKLLADVKTAYDSGIITLSQDRAMTTWLDGEAKQLEEIASKRAKVVSEIASARQLAASTASNVAGIASVQGFATSGVNGLAVSVGTMISGLSTDLRQIKKFGVNIKKLAKMGLDKNYLSQLIALGPVQGGELAEELAVSGIGDIKQINSLETQISSASGAIGKMAANIQYEGGKYASQGFLKELEAQKAALDKAGQRIAQALVKELRKDLGPGGAAATNKVEIRIVGGDRAFREWLKKSIRITGGQVQVIGA